MSERPPSRARLVGMNHVALPVGDIDAAVEFYLSIFEFEIRGRSGSKAFLDIGDQFLALGEVETVSEVDDGVRHLGVVVDDASLVERRLEELDIERLDTAGLDFRDPWSNRIQVVEYANVQFTKAEHVLDGMELSSLEKSEAAIGELAKKDMAPK